MELALVPGWNYYWRLTVTAGCFAAFGVGGVLLTALVFPLMRLVPGGANRRHRRTQRLIHRFFALLVAILRKSGVMRLETSGAERLRECRAALVLANHPTYIDVVVLLALMPEAGCVVKAGLWRNPFFGGVVRAAGYISNSAPESLVEDCAAALEAGQPLVIFPEGTRSRPGTALKFLRGAACIALQSGAPMLPVVLRCDPPTLTKAAKWYHIPPRPFRFRVDVLSPLQARELLAIAEPRAIAARKLTESLERYFTRELEAHGRPAT